MSIRVVNHPEPLSPASARLTEGTATIASDAWRVLTAELERYCAGHLRGRSFLISGHRGAGKTTLVLSAYESVRRQREHIGEVRPLLVEINGPALFRTEPAAEPRASVAPQAAGEAPPEPWQHALKQIVVALHRAVAKEVCQAHRQRVLDTTSASSRVRRELLELSAQMELELFECPMPARLRQFWDRPRLLDAGVLFQPLRNLQRGGPIYVASTSRPDQGMRELVALAGVCEAYCRVTGTFSGEERRSESASREAKVSLEATPSPLVAPAVSLLTGALVGVGSALANATGTASAAAGVVAALASATVFKFSGTRSSTRTVSRELNFMPDLSVRTLDRFVPLLVDRLVSAGLPPVFLVDELDKVENLTPRMVELLSSLKKIFAETAFFCFVTNRHYFEELRQVSSDGAYPPSSTFFSDQLFIAHGHEDLHRYLRERVQPPEGISR